MSPEQTPAEKLLNERQLFDVMSNKVIERAIRVQVDNGPRGTWPGAILVEAERRLLRDANDEELTSYKIDRTLEDVVIQEGFGAFYFDAENKRHLRLNPNGYNGKFWD